MFRQSYLYTKRNKIYAILTKTKAIANDNPSFEKVLKDVCKTFVNLYKTVVPVWHRSATRSRIYGFQWKPIGYRFDTFIYIYFDFSAYRLQEYFCDSRSVEMLFGVEDIHESQTRPKLAISNTRNITMTLSYLINYQIYCACLFVRAVSTKEIKIF